jgi:UDP-2-acetamido-2,6-beta-L-arabino-hexul-4-ose reductase
MKVLITGARGFIGMNLAVRVQELAGWETLSFTRNDSPERLPSLVGEADAIVHLAGENRPKNEEAFEQVNVGLTEALCDAIRSSGRRVPFLFTSSAQAEAETPSRYGQSKLLAERSVERLAAETRVPAVIYRLPGVFGKWCRPDYNSVVATFCHRFANQLPITINDAAARLRLVYIDDVVEEFLTAVRQAEPGLRYGSVSPEYELSVGELAEQIRAFVGSRESLMTGRVGGGFMRALYATYLSYLPKERFSYPLVQYADSRGTFVELLKTPDCGQFSFFTAHPGITRGRHYHHTKSEKFLVVRGRARFAFRHILSNTRHEIVTSGDDLRMVETVPGWIHDVSNIGEEELLVMLWSNELFDPEHPDTIPSQI